MILLLAASLFCALAISSYASGDESRYIEEKDIIYDAPDGIEMKLDMKTLDDGKNNKPAVIAIHGGGWEEGSKTDGMWMGDPVVNMGYTVFAINYRLTPVAPFPAQIEDCKSSVRFVRANAKRFNINPDKIGTYGHSAGGHLASILGTLPQGVFEGKGNPGVSSEVQAAISYAGVEYFYVPDKIEPNDFYDRMFGKGNKNVKLWLRLISPLNYVSKDSAPHLLLFGSTDDLVSPENGVVMNDALKKAGVYSEYCLEEGGWHILSAEFVNPRVQAFLEKTLGKP